MLLVYRGTSGDHICDLQFRARLWEFLAAPKSGMMLKHYAHAIYSSPMATSPFFCFSCQLRFPSVLRAIATIQRHFASAPKRPIGHSCFTAVGSRGGFGWKWLLERGIFGNSLKVNKHT